MQLSKAILVDIDAILDTRLAVIGTLYPELVEDVAKSSKYRLRRSDKMSLVDARIDDSAFALAYQRRDKELLKTSKLTMIVSEFKHVAATYLQTAIENNPIMRDCFLVFNIYPYDLNIDEIEVLAEVFKRQSGIPQIDCGFINKSPADLTPSYLKEIDVKAWLLYDYSEWMQNQYGDHILEESGKQVTGVPEIAIYTAKLLGNEAEEKQLMDELLEEVSIDTFEAIRIVYADIAEFHFYPVSSYTRLELEVLRSTGSAHMDNLNSLGIEAHAVAKILKQSGIVNSNSARQLDLLSDKLVNLAYQLKIDAAARDVPAIRAGLASIRWLSNNLYYASPFDQAADTERYIDFEHAKLDRDDASYLETEKYYNSLGIATIKQTIDDEDDGVVHRCICANNITNQHGSFAKDSVLIPIHNLTLGLDPVEDIRINLFMD